MKLKQLAVVSLAVLALAGCKQKPIQGTVFVVTQGGLNVKLGDVKVDVVSRAEVHAMIEQRQGAIHQAWESNQAALKQAADELQRIAARAELSKTQCLFTNDPAYIALRTERDRTRQQVTAYEALPVAPLVPAPRRINAPVPAPAGADAVRAYAMRLRDAQSPQENAHVPQSSQSYVDLNKARAYAFKLEVQMKEIGDAYNQSNQASVIPAQVRVEELQALTQPITCSGFFADFSPRPVASTRTDAEGSFTMELPKGGPYSIFATAQRDILNDHEVYFWIVDVAPDQQRIQLSNNNMVQFATNDIMLP